MASECGANRTVGKYVYFFSFFFGSPSRTRAHELSSAAVNEVYKSVHKGVIGSDGGCGGAAAVRRACDTHKGNRRNHTHRVKSESTNLTPNRHETSAVVRCRVVASAVAGRTPVHVLRLLRSELILFFYFYFWEGQLSLAHSLFPFCPLTVICFLCCVPLSVEAALGQSYLSFTHARRCHCLVSPPRRPARPLPSFRLSKTPSPAPSALLINDPACVGAPLV